MIMLRTLKAFVAGAALAFGVPLPVAAQWVAGGGAGGGMNTNASNATSGALQAQATAAGTASLALGGALSSTYSGSGVYPASTTFGWSLTNNFFDSEVAFWNTKNNSGYSFIWQQKTGASTALLLADLYNSGGATYYQIYDPVSTTHITFLKRAVGASGIGVDDADIFSIYTNNTARLVAAANGGIFTLNATGGSQGVDTINASHFYKDGVEVGTSGGGMFGYSDNGLTLTAGTRYVPVYGSGTPSTTEADYATKSPSATTVSNLQVNLSADPGSGQTLVVTLRKNGSDTTLTCTITGPLTPPAAVCQDVTHSVSVAQNDKLAWKVVTTGTFVATPSVTILSNNGTTNNGVTGSGTANKIAKFTGTASAGDSSITDDGTTVTLTTAVVGAGRIVSTTSDTPAASDCGKTIHSTNAGAVAVTLPNNITALECTITFIQEGAGQLTFTAASGATLHSFHSYTKTAGQWAVVDIILNTNAGGTSAVYTLAGDGA